jgi:hypothetical protein
MPNKANMANRADTPIMPDIANMARNPGEPDVESMSDRSIMADRADTPVMPNTANTPIMPDRANMARILREPDAGIMPDMAIILSSPGISDSGIVADMADTSIVPLMPTTAANTAMMSDKANKPKWYNRHDYKLPHYKGRHHKRKLEKAHARAQRDDEKKNRDQCQQERALAWWEAYGNLQAAQREVEFRTARHMNAPDPENSNCLYEA